MATIPMTMNIRSPDMRRLVNRTAGVRDALLSFFLLGCPSAALAADSPDPTAPWTRERAWDWYVRQPWLCGFNYIPSTACNTTEWWQEESFDAPTIERELGWAADLGFNAARAFTQFLVWKHDPEGFKDRLESFLSLAARRGIRVIPVLFDDCSFGDPPQKEPFLGKQREPIPGMILPSWTPSPGLSRVTDRASWPDLERYVRDVVGAFSRDERIVLWDLYNEPGNSGMGDRSRPLVQASFGWARAARPQQPLTVGIWSAGLAELNRVQAALSDIVSFHAYTDHAGMERAIAGHEGHLRPLVCTEWMARATGGRFDTDLPLFRRRGVGCLAWGLVSGRTQCQFPWWNRPGGQVDPKAGWFHDILHADGTPYRPYEIEAIRAHAADPRIDWALVYRPLPRRPAPRPGEIDDRDPPVRYSEGWTAWEGDGPRGGTLHHAKAAGSSAELEFAGTKIDLLHKMGPDCGIARILIDGKPAERGELDTFSRDVRWNVRNVIADGLPPGRHVLRIEVTGRKAEDATDAYVQIVGFDVR